MGTADPAFPAMLPNLFFPERGYGRTRLQFEFAGRFRRRRRRWDVGRRRWRRLFGRWRQLPSRGRRRRRFIQLRNRPKQLSWSQPRTRQSHHHLSFRHYGLALNNGLVAWYPLDGNGTDQSATANHATVYGATPTADRHGVAGKALLFEGSGSNDYLQAPFNQALSSSAISYSVWAKPIPPPTTMAARLPSGVMAVDSTYTRCLTTPGLTGPETVDGRNSILSL